MAFDFSNFINEYFTNPLRYPDRYAPYNVYNTIAFAVVALVVLYLLYRFLQSRGINVDEKFYWAVIPFVFLGSVVRVLVDAQVLPRGVEIAGITFYPFVTPVVYVVVFAITLGGLLVCRKMGGENWLSLFSKFGWVLTALLFLPLVPLFKNFSFLAIVTALMAVVWYVSRIAGKKWNFNSMDRMLILSQGLDGAATFVGVQFAGYSEQHVVGNAIFSAFGGPWAFFLIKVAFGFLVVYALRKELTNNSEQYAYVALLITIFGLAPGTRDLLRTVAGV